MSKEQVGEKLPYFQGIHALLKLAEGKKASYFRLVGSRNEETVAFDFFAIFPRQKGEYELFSTVKGNTLYWFFNYILGLSLSTEAWRVSKDDRPKRLLLENQLARLGVPSIVLTVGRTESDNLAVDLFAIPGISLSTALEEIKEAINKRFSYLASFN